MLRGISWWSFIQFNLAGCVIYYLVIVILYYRKDLVHLVKRRRDRSKSI